MEQESDSSRYYGANAFFGGTREECDWCEAGVVRVVRIAML
jgi:hypothetical protein